MTPIEQQFIEYYNETSLPVRKIRVKLGLKQHEYYKLREKLKPYLKQRKWGNHKKTIKNTKNYSYCNLTKSFQIKKKGVYYGCCKTEKQAQRMVELFNENNWNVNLKDEVKKQAIQEATV